MKFEIQHRWDTGVKVVLEGETRDKAIKKAIQDKVDLRGSDLRGSDLRGSDLRGSNLSGSNLRRSDLSGSNLRRSNLSGSDLSGSDLSGSDLSGSDLSGSNLSDSNLSGSDLSGSNLSGSNLSDSNLRRSDLRRSNLRRSDLRGSNLSGSDLSDSNLSGSNLLPIRDDLWAVLSSEPIAVEGLRQAIINGKIDGSTYVGDCACLVGTIANVEKKTADTLPILKTNASRPAECFFIGIKKGDTPENNQASKLALEWVDQWLANMKMAFSK